MSARIGVVSYCEGVARIWSGMRTRLAARNFNLAFRLFDTYEKQNAALLAGEIDIAWNGPLAHVQLERATRGRNIALGMRDVDRDFPSYLITNKTPNRPHLQPRKIENGATIVGGSRDSPQAYILPLFFLKEHHFIDLRKIDMVRYDCDLGKHGDTGLGEKEVLKDICDDETGERFGLVSKLEFDRCKDKDMLEICLRFPGFDHCQFDCLDTLPVPIRLAFQSSLYAMDITQEADARVMREEGIHQKWMPPRESGYDAMRRAVELMTNANNKDFHFRTLTVKRRY